MQRRAVMGEGDEERPGDGRDRQRDQLRQAVGRHHEEDQRRDRRGGDAAAREGEEEDQHHRRQRRGSSGRG